MQACPPLGLDLLKLLILLWLAGTLHFDMLGQQHWELGLCLVCWEKVVCPSLPTGAGDALLGEQHLCRHLLASAVLGRIRPAQVWWLGWLLLRNIYISPFHCCSDTKMTFCQPVNGNCLLTQAASRSCDRFIIQDCKIASLECESRYASRRNTFSLSPPTTNCLAAE